LRPDWLKSKNPACAAVKREAEEDWGRCLPWREEGMSKKSSPSDERDNQQEPSLSLGQHDMPPPAPVDEDAFARRAGEI
jgi:hypothetical protein